MAINAVKEKSTLRLELDNGLVDGRQRVLSKNYSKVKNDASDEGLHGTAIVIAELQSKDLLRVKKVEETLLVSD